MRHVSVNMFGFLTPRTCKVIYNTLKMPSETLKTLSPDSWKCTCRKCSLLTSWWWSCSPEAKHFHQLVEESLLRFLESFFFRATRRSSRSLHTTCNNLSLHTTIKKRFYKNVSIVQVEKCEQEDYICNIIHIIAE